MTHKALKRSFNRAPEKQEKMKIGRELAGLPLLLSACAGRGHSTEYKGVDLTPGKFRPKIIRHEDGTKTVEGLEQSMEPFGNGGFSIGVQDLALIAAILLTIRFSKMKSSREDKKRDNEGGNV